MPDEHDHPQRPAMTPEPPYYAVVFSSLRTHNDDQGYAETAMRMVDLGAAMPGFLGIESVRGADRFGITVSYWKDEESIRNWQRHAEHLHAQRHGRERWYECYALRVCRVERASLFNSTN